MIRRTPHGDRLQAVPVAEAARMVKQGEAVPINSRLLREVFPEVETDDTTYQTKVMTPAKPGKRRKGRD